MKKNKCYIVACIALLCVICFMTCREIKDMEKTSDDIQVSILHGSYVIDCNNLNEVVGNADYVFVGNVVKEDETIYKDVVMIEDENGGMREVASPYTNYTIEVKENIKGKLIMGENIKLQKAGGISKDGKELVIYEDDEMPIEDNVYIFFAYAQPDGTLLVSGPTSNININSKERISRSSVYEDVIEAYDNQVETTRKRFVSEYDVENNSSK